MIGSLKQLAFMFTEWKGYFSDHNIIFRHAYGQIIPQPLIMFCLIPIFSEAEDICIALQ